jgi:hypothetical protein
MRNAMKLAIVVSAVLLFSIQSFAQEHPAVTAQLNTV